MDEIGEAKLAKLRLQRVRAGQVAARCPNCGGANVDVDFEHPEGERVFCFDCAARDVEREVVVKMEPLARRPVKVVLVRDCDRCPGCGKERPKDNPPGPPPAPGQWYCVNHRHLKTRAEYA